MHIAVIKSFTTAFAAALLTVGLAACGSSSSASSPATTPAASSGTSSGTSSAGSQDIAQYLTPPADLPVTTPLSKSAPKGISVIFINSGITQATLYFQGMQAAGAALGWNVKSVAYDPNNPATLTSSIQSAIAAKPNYLVLGALQNQQYQSELAAAKSNGVTVLSVNFSGAQPKGVYSVLNSDVELTYVGQILAKKMIADATKAGRTAHVLEVTVSAFAAIVGPLDAAVTSTLRSGCPSCTRSELDIALPNVFNGEGTTQIVSYLQAHPDINAVMLDGGQLDNGLTAALQQAGLADKVTRYGSSPGNVQIKELQNGQAGAWAIQPFQVGGWIIADQIARIAVGNPTNLWDDEHIAYLLTAANTAGVNPSDPEFPNGYGDMFHKLWRIS